MLSGAFSLIGPYSWLLFKERISWVKEPSEPKEKTRYPDWQRAGGSVRTAGVFHQDPQWTFPAYLCGSQTADRAECSRPAMKVSSSLLIDHLLFPHQHLLNKVQYLKSISNHSIHYLSHLPVVSDNTLYRKIVGFWVWKTSVWALIEFISLRTHSYNITKPPSYLFRILLSCNALATWKPQSWTLQM